MAQPEIIQVRPVYGDMLQPTRLTHYEVMYTIDGRGPFTANMPPDEYSPAKAKALIEGRAKEWSQTLGKLTDQR